MRVIITGGTGLIGRALSASFAGDGHEVIVLSRNPRPSTTKNPLIRQVKWDATSALGWGTLADGAEVIVNLAGEGIADSRWSDERKRRIYSSRVDAGKAVMEAITAATSEPNVLIQASAVGIYGSRGDETLTESSSPGSDFLAQVCFDWEASTESAPAMDVRRAVVRSGIVLSNEGGAWPRIVMPFKFMAGGPIGSGKQYWPWIHIDDEVAALRFLIENERAAGVFNLSAPIPLMNRDFADTLGRVMHRPSLLPVPSFALQVGFGEMSQVLLDSQRAVPQHLLEMNFTYKFASANAAFANLIGKA